MKMTATPRSRACRTYLSTTPAARQRPDRLVGIADVDSHLVQLRLHGALRGRGVEPVQRADARPWLRAEEEVPPDRHQRHHREILVDGSDALRARVAWRCEVHLLTVDEQPS